MEDDGPIRGAWAAVVLASLSTAAGVVAGFFLLNGAWPVGTTIGFIAFCVTVVLVTATAIVWIATKRP